jgi:hypothetical protein
MGRLTRRTLFAAAILGICLAAPAAHAACFESGIGCTDDHDMSKSALRGLSCDALWTARNTICDENGYCFRTARAKEIFSNEGCHVSNAAALKFNAYERANIDRIVAVERSKGCR